MALANNKNVSTAKKEKVLTKAVLKAGEQLGINAISLGGILGLSAATISRMTNQDYTLKTNKKEFELGLEFVRLFRGIDAITGGDNQTNKSWLTAYNKALGDKPIELIKSVRGLINTVAYVDTFRAKI